MIMKAIPYLLTAILCFSMSTPVLAQGIGGQGSFPEYPMVDDFGARSETGEPYITYTEDGFYIQSYSISKEDIELANLLSKPHTHSGDPMLNHFNLIPHYHGVRNVVNGSSTYWVWRPESSWTRNDQFPNESTWPSVSWTTSQTTTATSQVSLSVGVTDSIVAAEIGAEYTNSHTVGTSYTRTFFVPYMRDGRVKVNYYRPYKSITCVTTYIYSTNPYVTGEETGPCNAQGTPYDIVVNLEVRTF